MTAVLPRTMFIGGEPRTITIDATAIQVANDIEIEDVYRPQPRKRQRLTHLSPDERLNRRKLKNRVAAQTARDRKKARMDELEDMLALAQEENDRLREENDALRSQQVYLDKENNALRERVPQPTCDIKTEPKSDVIQRSESTSVFESAEGTDVDPLRLDDTLTGLSNDLEHDIISELFDTLPDTAAHTSGAHTEAASAAPGPATGSDDVVGPTPAELESLNELIRFDHEYVKPKPVIAASRDDETVVEEIQQVDSVNIVSKDILDLPELLLDDLTFDGVADLDILSTIDSSVLCSEASTVPTNTSITDSTTSSRKQLPMLYTEVNHQSKLTTDQLDHLCVDSLLTPMLDGPVSPHYSSFSESGYSSDGTHSPHSVSEETCDSTWEESFTELFPSLI